MALPPTAAARDKVREEFGPDFVPARRAAEDEARSLLPRAPSDLTRDRFTAFCEALRRHQVGEDEKHDRFAPTFQDKRVAKMAGRLDEITPLLGPVNDALAHLDLLLPTAGHKRIPDAVPRLPTVIMYLRDPDRFGYETLSTMNGLALALGGDEAYSDKSRGDYERFCYDLRLWRQEWGIAPQEHDAVLSEISSEWQKHTGKKLLGQ